VLHHLTSDDPILLYQEISREVLYLQSLAPGIHIHCFDPDADARSRLELNIKSNHLGSSISVYPMAIFNAETTVELKEAALSAHRSAVASQFVQDHQSATVQAIPLQRAMELAGTDRIDLLKIDVEGAEIEIVEGADPVCWQNIERVVVEYHDLLKPGCKESVTRVLTRQGYRGIRAFETSPGLGLVQAQRQPFIQ
jgi:FkbM family methyltransferase